MLLSRRLSVRAKLRLFIAEVHDMDQNSQSENGIQTEGTAENGAETDLLLRYENRRQVAKGGILGFLIGLAVIVPGVSGSAMAIIFKLYEKLLYALGNFFRKFKMCLLFLLPIVTGLVAGFVLGFFGVRELLNFLPFATVALFAGLMTGAYPAVTDQLKGARSKKTHIILFVVGLAIPIMISTITAFSSTGERSLDRLGAGQYILFLVLGYAVAITQLVPGLSATALLMSVGHFTPLMNSVSLSYWQANPQILLVYATLLIGFIAGLFTVSKILSFIMKRYRRGAFFTIAGLSLGSIVTMLFNSEILAVYRSWAIAFSWIDLALGIVLFAIGIVAAYFFVKYERANEKANKNIKSLS